MALTQAQRSILEKARSLGGGGQAVALPNGACAFLAGIVASDLELEEHFPEIPFPLPPLYSEAPLSRLEVPNADCNLLFERLVELNPDADTYFACVAALHKARLKYERILEMQPMPTFDQVGPRGLLQFGTISTRAVIPFMFWRKWFYDIDNRAGQETGYLFEPIIASAIGGSPAGAARSPILSHRDPGKRRQVDCLRENYAYEFKIRVTIAASGQGRWREELDFPVDCQQSGYIPVLVVLDPTDNPKLAELAQAFLAADGKVYLGEAAWGHLEGLAGDTMSRFLDKYVRLPMGELLAMVTDRLESLEARMVDDEIHIISGGEMLRIHRSGGMLPQAEEECYPPDSDAITPGP